MGPRIRKFLEFTSHSHGSFDSSTHGSFLFGIIREEGSRQEKRKAHHPASGQRDGQGSPRGGGPARRSHPVGRERKRWGRGPWEVTKGTKNSQIRIFLKSSDKKIIFKKENHRHWARTADRPPVQTVSKDAKGITATDRRGARGEF